MAQQMRLPFPRKSKANTCGHPDAKHYAKGQCVRCYHRKYRIDQPMLVALAQERYQRKRAAR